MEREKRAGREHVRGSACLLMLGLCGGSGGGVTNFSLMFTQSSDPVGREQEKGKTCLPIM